MVQWYPIHIPEHVTFRIFQKFLLEMGKRKTFRSCFYIHWILHYFIFIRYAFIVTLRTFWFIGS